MDQSIRKLTLVYPLTAEDALTELLLASEPPLPGFTTWMADGHGVGFDHASPGEKVRGRIRRGMLVLIAPEVRVRPLLEEIAAKLAIPRLLYWLEPVLEVGRLAEVATPPEGAEAAGDVARSPAAR